MTLRTQFIDDEVCSAISAGVRQFVLVGAGYDGRALRFRHPGSRWFEVDHPATQADKQCRVRKAFGNADEIGFAPVDLLRDDVRDGLRAAGHDAAQPSLFICEGLFTYLPNDTVATLCRRLSDVAAPASGLVASTLVVPAGSAAGVQAFADSVLALMGERRKGIFHPGTVEAILADNGWSVTHQAATRRAPIGGSYLLLVSARQAVEFELNRTRG